jgi:hypothetical protein
MKSAAQGADGTGKSRAEAGPRRARVSTFVTEGLILMHHMKKQT